MTARQIIKQVQEQADVRFADVIERLLSILRTKHTHQCWRRECDCEYCQFINGQYVDAKLNLHWSKVRLKIIDNEYYDNECPSIVNFAVNRIIDQLGVIRKLKKFKKELQGNIL